MHARSQMAEVRGQEKDGAQFASGFSGKRGIDRLGRRQYRVLLGSAEHELTDVCQLGKVDEEEFL